MKKEVELFLYRSANSDFTFVDTADMSGYGDVLIAPTVSIEIDFNLYDEGVLRQKEIESIDKEIDRLREESLRKIIELGERKQKLMAIEHEPST